LLRKIEKIKKLEKKLETPISELNRKKIQNRIDKLKNEFTIIVIGEHNDAYEKPIIVYVDKYNRKVIVEENEIIPINFMPSIHAKFQAYILTIFILIFLYVIVEILTITSIIPSTRYAYAFSFVLTASSIALNVWTLFTSKNLFKTHKLLMLLIIVILILNLYLIVGKLSYFGL
jgi:hypothetical protein